MRNLLISLSLLLFFLLDVSAQQTTIFTEANAAFKQGVEYYDKGLYSLARNSFQSVVNLLQPANEPESEQLKKEAILYHAKSVVRLNLPDGEKLILDFARKYEPDPIANKAVLEMANYYFNAKEYERAGELFARINTYDLTKKEEAEVTVQTGYTLFVRKHFREAKTYFDRLSDTQDIYYYPSNYYLGMCAFFMNDYDEALRSFRRVTNSKRYGPYIPYALTAIQFAQANTRM